MTAIGLEVLKHRENKRHNVASEAIEGRKITSNESIAAANRQSSETIAEKNRRSSESIARLNRTSAANIASMDRQSKEKIASLDRTARDITNIRDNQTKLSGYESNERIQAMKDLTAQYDRQSREDIAADQLEQAKELSDDRIDADKRIATANAIMSVVGSAAKLTTTALSKSN